ncbi:DNA mismatch repair endonuclease MutL [Desulfogranum japonicum]|uniref:DNA mismatch repair endonuclease MutL n=1 Tax=Desulfogranum japonicum TaxID=231447 RepID=UPI00042A66BB|nr:DNA mismatch repair endonuclease MutL [Desulfogranum japonicum]
MARIRILSEQLANQIAAGEVVERPASVVKELLENSVDSGANRIDVNIEGSGVRLIRVIDDGCGMMEDDVLLSLERHATSKLQEENQLSAIATLGFRGEAIPSIGSVSRMTIISRTHDRDTGTRAEIRYGTLHHVHEEGCQKGTTVEVRHLFGNMPARKKFLKSARTESFHVEEAVKNQALACPHIGFSLLHDGRTVFEYPEGGDLESRLRDVFSYDAPLLSLEHTGASAGNSQVVVGGYILLPESTPSSKARLRILVNGRPVQDSMIRHAVSEGLQGFLMKGYQPAGVVTLTLSPDQVDVNVHPAKREIRFRQAQDVRKQITLVVAKSLAKYQEQTRKQLFSVPDQTERADQTDRREFTVAEQVPEMRPQLLRWPEHTGADTRKRESLTSRPGGPVHKMSSADTETGTNACREKSPQLQKAEIETESRGSGSSERVESECYQGLRVIGQLFSLYILCERNGELVVIDQHAAHERILYGQFLEAYLSKDVPQQSLLFPVTVELGPDQMEMMEKYQAEVERLGLEVKYFGDTTWVITSVPALVSILEPVTVLTDILDGLRDSGPQRGHIPAGLDAKLASMACRAAIKAGDSLSPREIVELLSRMEQSEFFSHCPHGRPVMKVFSAADIEKWFHRHGG